MAEPVVHNDDTLDAALNENKPVLMIFSNGNLRGDFNAAFRKAAEQHTHINFVKVNPIQSPKCAERFDIGDKPVMIGWLNGEEILRRTRPWGSDVPLAIEMLEAAYQEANPEPVSENHEENTMQEQTNTIVDTQPVVVTDATFQKEVI
ncbi:MAG: hypothetical protein D6737_03125, partial [Chloroflexi bacterium]